VLDRLLDIVGEAAAVLLDDPNGNADLLNVIDKLVEGLAETEAELDGDVVIVFETDCDAPVD